MPNEVKEALIVVRAYPVPRQQAVEVSCTAAMTHAEGRVGKQLVQERAYDAQADPERAQPEDRTAIAPWRAG